MLGGRHHEAVDADDVLVEGGQLHRRVVRKNLAPGLGPEAGNEVDAAHRRPRLAQRGDRTARHRSPAFPAKHRTRGTRAPRSRARRCRSADYESRPCHSLREATHECKRRVGDAAAPGGRLSAVDASATAMRAAPAARWTARRSPQDDQSFRHAHAHHQPAGGNGRERRSGLLDREVHHAAFA